VAVVSSMLMLDVIRLLSRKKSFLFVSCVALFGGFGGLLSYLYFKRKRLSGHAGSLQPPDAHETNKPPRNNTTNTNTFPRLRDLTRRTVVSISTVGTVLASDEVEYEQGLQTGSLNGSLNVIRQIASKADLYLITRCDEADTFTYQHVHNILQQNGIFDAGLNPNKHLSCSTVIGKAHIARQLESTIHIDRDEEVINHLQRFTPHLLLISNEHTGSNNNKVRGSGTVVASSLQQLFSPAK